MAAIPCPNLFCTECEQILNTHWDRETKQMEYRHDPESISGVDCPNKHEVYSPTGILLRVDPELNG